MLKRFIFLPVCIVIVLGAALSARASAAASASLPAEVLAFPADSLAVLSLDVKRVLASPLSPNGQKPGTPVVRDLLNALRERLGVNAERDVDRLFAAVGAEGGPESNGLLLLYGRFNRSRMGQILKGNKRESDIVDISGSKAFIIRDHLQNKIVSTAVCILNPETVVVGAPSAVERLLQARLAGRRPLLTNVTLSRLIDQAQTNADLWLAADAALLKRIRLGRGKTGPPMTLDLPQLRDITLTGIVADALTLRLIGKTADETTARNTADVARGLLLLASLNAKHPEWQTIASLVNIEVKQSSVHLDARLPYALIAQLPSFNFGAASR
jgi:hypothetical protein